MSAAPPAWAACATSTAVMECSSRPERILTVTGRGAAASRKTATRRSTRAGSRRRPPPAPSATTRRWDLALTGTLDLGQGATHDEILASGLEVNPGRASLEVLTAQDPIPGSRVRVSLTLPRSQEPILVVARVRGASTEDTTMISAGQVAAAAKGLQRIMLDLEQPGPFLQRLGARW